MLTLTRKVGQRTFIGSIEVEVVDIVRDGVVLRVHGVENESSVTLADSSSEEASTRTARRVVPSRQDTPIIVAMRRSRRHS